MSYGFCNPETSKNRTRYMIFPDYIIRTPPKHHFSREKQFRLYNPNCISTNLNMFVTWIVIFGNYINLPNFHPSVLSYCYLFSVKNRVFELLDWIASKLPQKIRKNSRIMTPLKETSFGLRPSKSKIPSFRPIFHFLKFFIFSEKSEKICISFI